MTGQSEAKDQKANASQVPLGAGLMIAGCFMLTVNDAFMKLLVSDLPLGQVVGLRGLMSLGLLIVLAPWLGGYRELLPHNKGRVALLTGILLINYFIFPYSLKYVPLADAIMLAYLSPVVVVMISPFMLGEQVGWRRWSAVAIGVLGAALVINPEGETTTLVIFIPLLVAILVGVRDTLTRRYIWGESPLALVAAASLGSGVIGAATFPFDWTPLSSVEVTYLSAAAVFLTGAQFLMVVSFRYADATVLSCLKYTSIIWAAAIGWMIWDDVLTVMDWAGAGLIAFSGILITIRTHKRAVERKASA